MNPSGDATSGTSMAFDPYEDLIGLPPDPQEMHSMPVAELDSQGIRDRFPALDWHALWLSDEAGQGIEWIVEPVLPAHGAVAIYSAPGVGKSLLSLELAAGIASGRSTFGSGCREPRSVLYLDHENRPRETSASGSRIWVTRPATSRSST